MDRRKSAQPVPFRDKASQSLIRPTWRSQQRREQAGAEATAAGVAAAEPDIEFGRLDVHEDEGGDAGDDAMVDIGGAHDSAVGEPESEPDSEPREAKQQPKVDVEDRGSDEGSADDGVVQAEEDVLPVLPQESRPSIEEYRAKWERLLAQHSKPVEGAYSIGNLVPKPIHQLWQNCPYVPFEHLISEEVFFV